MQRLPVRHLSSIALAITALASAGAHAQAAAPDAAASAPADDVQTVTVTAQGRKQEVQKVPIAIQLLGPEQIAKVGAVNLAQVADFVPGLAIDASQPTQPSYSLRGLGNGDFGIGTDAPVGVYVNGVYTGKTGGALLNFNDVKRVEVLKGPQGTLFGRNSAGGAISIVTNDPDGQNLASGLVRAGNYGTVHAEGVLNRALSEDFDLRISAVGEKSDGWATNATDGRKNPQAHTWGTRMGARWSPSDDTSVVLTWEHEDLNERPRPIWAAGSFNEDRSVITYIDPRHEQLRNDAIGGVESRLFNGLNLRIEHELGDRMTFTSTTGWRHFNSVNVEDNDGTDNPATYLSTGNFEKSSTFEQEFRLNGKSRMADWLVGASFSTEHSAQLSRVNTNTTTLDPVLEQLVDQQLIAAGQSPLPGPPLGLLNGIAAEAGVPGFDLLGQSWEEGMHNTLAAHSEALMADVIWHVGDRTNVTTGVRFTQDTKKFSWYSPLRSAPGLDAQLGVLSPDFFNALVAAGAIDQPTADGLSGLVQGLQGTNIEFTNPEWMAAPVYSSKTWHNTSPRLVIDHQLTPDTMVYGSVTRGYQAGGFNSVSTQANNGRFDPETITSYELGAKGRVAEAGITYSASLFHYLFKNLQAITFVQPTDGGVGHYEITVSNVEATGVDGELNWQVAAPLRLFANGEWIDQKYKGQTNPVGNDLTGQPYGTPMLSLAAGLDVTLALAGGKADWTLQGSHIGATRCNADSATQGSCLSTPTYRVGEAHDRVDTRLGWSAPADRWGVALIVNNLFDKRYVTGLSNLSAAVGVPYTASVTDPRRFQIEFSAKL
ncbi:TonB-dependent receptor [Scleromatobacter humisilvae]|uniref:TonB-dependent receptor n=1 Tax=Scleromatobacter humisilvae TaxID=2897159 RepID=A0A9X1YPG5_9BURK|nr:TonB-dependent receptor [Scleromatobacter humisilvae]MCK9688222.1 TonB-dependent receptor [Scleromatobacter humisilvae]